MPPGCRLSLLVPVLVISIAGCAPQFLVVPDEDWHTVPAGQRAAIDRQHDGELAAARAELEAATAGLAALVRQPAPPRPPPPRTTPSDPAADPDDEWVIAVHRHEQAAAFSYARVETARAAWQTADQTWRKLRYEAAVAQVDMVTCARELARAKAIDHNLPGSDHYDVAPLRGQFSRAQQRWYSHATAASAARTVLEQASAELTTAKEAYAQLMRNGPMLAADQPAARPGPDEPPPRLQLSGWSVNRSDIRRRRGLGNLLDEAERAPARLRTVKVRLPRPIAIRPTKAPATTATAPAARAAEAPAAGKSATATARPADAPAAGKSATATARPAEAPAAAKSASAAARPADAPAASESATATAKPAEASAASKSATAAAAKPAAAPANGKQAAAAPAASKQAAAAKPAEASATSKAIAAKPVEAPATSKPANTTADAKPPSAGAPASGGPGSTGGGGTR